MGFLNRVSRRTVMAGQAAFAALAAIPGLGGRVHAAPAPVTAGGCAAVQPAACVPARWHSATAAELQAHVGERFRVQTATQGSLVLQLVAVEAHDSGAARPADLPRREAVTALFDSPDKAPLVAGVSGVHRVSHPRIGSANLYMTASPRRNGDHHIEVVLN